MPKNKASVRKNRGFVLGATTKIQADNLFGITV